MERKRSRSEIIAHLASFYSSMSDEEMVSYANKLETGEIAAALLELDATILSSESNYADEDVESILAAFIKQDVRLPTRDTETHPVEYDQLYGLVEPAELCVA